LFILNFGLFIFSFQFFIIILCDFLFLFIFGCSWLSLGAFLI